MFWLQKSTINSFGFSEDYDNNLFLKEYIYISTINVCLSLYMFLQTWFLNIV